MCSCRWFKMPSFLAVVGITAFLYSIPLAASQDSREHHVSGMVYEENGQPAANAIVWLLEVPTVRFRVAKAFGKVTTGPQGQFRFTVPRDWFESAHPWRSDLGLVAHRVGRKPAGIILTRASMPPESGVRLILRPAAGARFQLRQPDGQPSAGCSVAVIDLLVDQVRGPAALEGEADPPVAVPHQSPHVVFSQAVPEWQVLRREPIQLPQDLTDILTARTDTDGQAVVPDIAFEDVAGIRAQAEKFGVQEFRALVDPWSQLRKYKPLPETVTLKPVGKVTGRLTPEAALKGQKISIHLRSSEETRSRDLWSQGVAHVLTDAQGRFEVPALAAGYYFTEFDPLTQFTPVGPTYGTLQAGGTAEMNIALKNTVKVRGQVRARGTGRPLAHVHLVHYSPSTQTDSEGRFSLNVMPGPLQWQAIYGPDIPALSPQEAFGFKRDVPANVEQFDLPPLKLPTLDTVNGTVVNEANRPAPFADVTVVWLAYDYRTGTMRPRIAQTTTDIQGAFTVSGIAVNRIVRLKARQKASSTANVTVARGDELSKPITLRVNATAAQTASGRVLDEDGRPMANTQVELWWRPEVLAMHACLPEPLAATPGSGAIPHEALPPTLGPIPEIRLALETPLITDADGRFQTPRVLDADGEYAVVVRVPGFVPAQSNWKALTGGQPLQWGDLQLNRRRPLEGQVVDRQGQPVAGAKVVRSDSRSLLRTSTDASGHFKFELVVETPGFLFVEADGFRFHGQISDATKPVRVSLTRNDEPVANVTRSLPPAISKEQSRTLVAGILTSEATKALDEDKDEERSGPLEGLARTDPARVLEILEKKPLKNEWFDGYVRRAVVKSLLKESPEEARTVADSIRDPSFRVFGYLDLYDAASREQADLRRQLLAQALLHARAVKEADHRVIYLGRVAERLLAAGEKEQASKIFSEGKDIAKALPTAGWSAYARAAFATSLSVVDLPAALNLTGDLKDAREFDRHHGNIARKIARTKPSEAERVLGMVRQQWHRDQYAVGVCWRMAPVEMNRARVIADRADNVLSRAQAYGALAQALTKTDKNEAIRMLRRAFAILGEKAAKGEQDYNNFMGSSSLAAMLVGVAEGIDPGLVSEFLWKAVSFRVPRLGEVPMQETHPTGWFADAALAYAVARYDRRIAGLLLEEATPTLLRNLNYGGNHLLAAMTIVDPVQAVHWLEALGKDDYRRQRLATRLLSDPDDLTRRVQSDLGMLSLDDDDE